MPNSVSIRESNPLLVALQHRYPDAFQVNLLEASIEIEYVATAILSGELDPDDFAEYIERSQSRRAKAESKPAPVESAVEKEEKPKTSAYPDNPPKEITGYVQADFVYALSLHPDKWHTPADMISFGIRRGSVSNIANTLMNRDCIEISWHKHSGSPSYRITEYGKQKLREYYAWHDRTP